MAGRHFTISWAKFEVCNSNPQEAFEAMCRMLFNRHFFDNKALLHSNPNNPGIEVEPALDAQNRRISFQAKYLSNNNYPQILHSARQAVKYYSGQLDIIYLYCNRDLETTSKSYLDIEAVLRTANIDLIPINNQEILGQVLNHPVVSSQYFYHHGITHDWFCEHLQLSLESLGPRYNDQFNVHTKTENYVDLFCQSKGAIARINQRKVDAIEEIRENRRRYSICGDFVDRICSAIGSLEDVGFDNILHCLTWESYISEMFSNEIAEADKEIEVKKAIYSGGQIDETGLHEMAHNIARLRYIANIPSLLCFSETEKNLLQQKIFILQGEAGTGKSQLFANAAQKIIHTQNCALLLLGHTYLSDDQIANQILSQLGCNLNIDDFFDVLEGIGETGHHCVVVFIDAINESGNKDVWRVGLIQLINKINKLNHVRLAVSVRTGYEALVFDEAVQQKIEKQEITVLTHTGFQKESLEATKAFLDHYKIPFSPSFLFQHELTNPLFLTLFCKTYSGQDFDVGTLFGEIIRRADMEAQKAVGWPCSSVVLEHLINELAEYFLSQNTRSINKKDLLELDFWNTYGLTSNKTLFLSALVSTGLFIISVYNRTEVYFLAYNLLEDFVCAKLIVERHSDKESLKKYLSQNLLEIKEGKITNYLRRDIFAVICGFYAEKYNEDLIDIIDSLSDSADKQYIIESYFESFLWRKSSAVDRDAFMQFLRQYPVGGENVWRVFIESSTKPNHPLNAEFLHITLMEKTLSHRDFLWTMYINELDDEGDRLFQLVEFFNKGNNFNDIDDNTTWLLLILFSWLLTSSNRFLRDKTSKAMIEILKINFQLCRPLLELFECVDDPYVIQRLYGVVFGACMKRIQKHEAEFRALSEYVFNTIFDQDMVYPDILLRDYARLIVERWVYEFSCDSEITIDITKARPPYRSCLIPVVEKEDYSQEGIAKSGFYHVAMSMCPDRIPNPGMYGDFGRYVFQAAATDFENIDMENLYHYAMQFIRDELGYDDELFGSYDTSLMRYQYSRHDTKKVERIGKKYQWIAMYNILARISDTHLLKEWDSVPHLFEGAWAPYVRDFDPTLNCNFLLPLELPHFDLSITQIDEFIEVTSENKSEIEAWTNIDCEFFSAHDLKLVIQDDSGQFWILLTQYENVENQQRRDAHAIGFTSGAQELWSMSHGYFVTQNEFEDIKRDLETKSFLGRWFPEGEEVYQLFNRECAWAPSCESLLSDSWLDYESETGETVIIKHTGLFPKFMRSTNDENDNIEEIMTFEEQEREQIESVKRTIGKIRPAYFRVLWEERYDASQKEATSFYLPCRHIIDYLQLEQREYDGYLYDRDGTLVSFDGELSGHCNGLIIRKDYFDRYLQENGLKFFWTCLGEKRYFLEGHNLIGSEWSGFLYLEGNDVIGDMSRSTS